MAGTQALSSLPGFHLHLSFLLFDGPQELPEHMSYRTDHSSGLLGSEQLLPSGQNVTHLGILDSFYHITNI